MGNILKCVLSFEKNMVLDCLNTIETSNNKEVDSTKLRIWGFFSKFYYCKNDLWQQL
jgi:hypothetical protein